MFLSDDEILQICAPLKQPSALCRRLRAMGFFLKVRPNGWPLVSRSHFEAVMMGLTSLACKEQTERPNVQALIDRVAARKAA